MTIRFMHGGLTDQGLVRKQNEDNWVADPGQGLCRGPGIQNRGGNPAGTFEKKNAGYSGSGYFRIKE